MSGENENREGEEIYTDGDERKKQSRREILDWSEGIVVSDQSQKIEIEQGTIS